MCRCGLPVRHWSGSAVADRTRSRAPPNVRSRKNLLRGGLGDERAVAIEHLVDLGQEIEMDHLIANLDGGGKALGIGAAMALDHDAVKAEQHAAVGLAGIELVAQLA